MILLHILVDVLRNAILVTGLVVIMMMMIESLNIESSGKLLPALRQSRVGQVVFSALLGSLPGCMGGFASVSLYTHGLISFGALVAMMIASSGDEAFVMLAMVPNDALWIFILLFAIAVVVGIVVDIFHKKDEKMRLGDSYDVHGDDCCHEDHKQCSEHRHGRHLSWQRVVMFLGVAVFIAALATGLLEHEHGGEEMHEAEVGGINLLSEDWMNIMFAALSVIILGVIIFASDHFVEEHLWQHIVCKHLPSIFAWTFGVLVAISVLLHFVDVSNWISNNTALMILLATLVGIIPESGPHMIFVTLYASGIVPLPVLLASCISQDGHASLPLLAESKSSFLKAKLINCAIALIVGFAAMLFMK